MRLGFVVLSVVVVALIAAFRLWWLLLIAGPLIAVGVFDMLQRRSTLLRNFPVIAHGRYFFEFIRPELQQYFIESNTDGTPFSREHRAIVYQRAKGALQSLPYGTQRDVYEPKYEWINHSIDAHEASTVEPRVTFGGPDCACPYDASLLNISGMSFGSLSAPALLALSRGAQRGGFAHNTGEGGVSKYHLEGGADLIWQIGTGYFGCRAADGTFDAERYKDTVTHDHVKMVELKLSQGAKPGRGGVLPGAKVTPEIAAARGVPVGRTVHSPPAHSAFATPTGLIEFLAKLREMSGGKPVGFKLCVGRWEEFFAICKAMQAVGTAPDFIAVDGKEGGTGAAPIEFTNRVGTPLREGLLFVHNALTATGLRDRVRVIGAGKLITGFDLFKMLALGADTANSARAMMLALGCIQARRCHDNRCPTGIATQNAWLTGGLDVALKSERVRRYHAETIKSLLELVAACGLAHPDDVGPRHVLRRTDENTVLRWSDHYPFLAPGSLDEKTAPPGYVEAWRTATPDRW